MNERIRELMNQAILAVDDPYCGNPLNEELAKMYIPDCFAEKFAELIVDNATECVRDVLREENSTLSYEDATAIQNRIKQHFGVK